jgi:hypothetical protein
LLELRERAWGEPLTRIKTPLSAGEKVIPWEALSCLPARVPDCQRNRCDHARGTVPSQLSIVADVPLALVGQPRSSLRTDQSRSPAPSKKLCLRRQSKNSSYNITLQIANRFHYGRSGAIFAFVPRMKVDRQSSPFNPNDASKSGRFLLPRKRYSRSNSRLRSAAEVARNIGPRDNLLLKGRLGQIIVCRHEALVR